MVTRVVERDPVTNEPVERFYDGRGQPVQRADSDQWVVSDWDHNPECYFKGDPCGSMPGPDVTVSGGGPRAEIPREPGSPPEALPPGDVTRGTATPSATPEVAGAPIQGVPTGGAIPAAADTLLPVAPRPLAANPEAAGVSGSEGGTATRLEGTAAARPGETTSPRPDGTVTTRLEGSVNANAFVAEANTGMHAPRLSEPLARDQAPAERSDPLSSSKAQEALRTAENRGAGSEKPAVLASDAARGASPADRQASFETVAGKEASVGRAQELVHPVNVPGTGPGGMVAAGPPGKAGLTSESIAASPGRVGEPPVALGKASVSGHGPEVVVLTDGAKPGRDPAVTAVDPGWKLAGINPGDLKTREALVDIVKRMDAGTFKPEQLDATGRKVYEALKSLEPARLEQLKQFLAAEAPAAGKVRADEVAVSARFKEMGEVGKEGIDKSKRLDPAESSVVAQKSATERLIDFMRANKDLIGHGLDSEKSKAAFVELGKIARDMNRELGLESIRGGTDKGPQERAQTGTGKGDASGAKLHPAPEAASQLIPERGPKAGLPTPSADRRPGTTRAEPDTQISGRTQQIEGRPSASGEGKPADARTASADAGGRGGVLECLGGKSFSGAKQLDGRPDLAVTPGAESDVGAASRSGDRLTEQVPDQVHWPEGGDLIVDSESETKKVEDQAIEVELGLTDAQLAALLTLLADDDKEVTEEQEEKAPQQDKQGEERRQKYVVKEMDTLESIAAKMLREARLAPLILEINKNSIPVREENGKKIVDLKPGMVIWLPTTTDIRDFYPPPAGPASGGGFPDNSQQPPEGQSFTPEEELAAKFGGRPEDYRAETSQRTDQAAEPDRQPLTSGQSFSDVTPGVVAATPAISAGVDRMLGQFSSRGYSGGRVSYSVRPGDSLKSVAMEHPALQDVRLWRLVAEVNSLPTETDMQGRPLAQLRIGQVLSIPSRQEIGDYGEKKRLHNEAQTFVQQLSEACRLVKLRGAGAPWSALKSRLEVKRADETWVPVVSYEIYDDVSLRHEFTPDGEHKTMRIDLPPREAQELAVGDLVINWKSYMNRFLPNQKITGQ